MGRRDPRHAPYLQLSAGLALLVAGLALPESLPADHRHRSNIGSLLRTYRRITSDHQSTLLSMSNALNFGARFLDLGKAFSPLESMRLSLD